MQPIQIELVNSDQAWYDSTLISSLLGLILGAGLALGAEALRRRADKKTKSGERLAAERKDRFSRERLKISGELEAIRQTSASLEVVNRLAAIDQLVPISAGQLILRPDAFTDSTLGERLTRLSINLRVLAGLDGAATTVVRPLIDQIKTDAPLLVGDVQAELAAKTATLQDMDLNGQPLVTAEVERLLK